MLNELDESKPFDAIVRIKEGAYIGQDRRFTHWPNCYPPSSEWKDDGENPWIALHRAKDPDILFCGRWTGRYWDCVADGYGAMKGDGEYGAGSIFVFKFDGVDVIE